MAKHLVFESVDDDGAYPSLQRVDLFRVRFGMEYRIVFLQGTAVGLVLFFLQEKELSVIVQHLIVGCEDKQTLAHPYPFYLVIIVVHQLDTRAKVLAKGILARQLLAKFVEIVVQVLGVQQITFRALTDGFLYHFVGFGQLFHLVPETMAHDQTIRKSDGIPSVQICRSTEQADQFLPASVTHIQGACYGTVVLDALVEQINLLFEDMDDFEDGVMNFHLRDSVHPSGVLFIGDG